jgi:hypothetical protein
MKSSPSVAAKHDGTSNCWSNFSDSFNIYDLRFLLGRAVATELVVTNLIKKKSDCISNNVTDMVNMEQSIGIE